MSSPTVLLDFKRLKGFQDESVSKSSDSDFNDWNHLGRKQELPVRIQEPYGGDGIMMILVKPFPCGVFNNVDLHIPISAYFPEVGEKNEKTLMSFIKRIEVDVGKQRFDRYGSPDLLTQINTIAALVSKPVRRVKVCDGTLVIPLHFSTFHNFILWQTMKEHELRITVEFTGGITRVNDTPSISLVASCYNVFCEKLHGMQENGLTTERWSVRNRDRKPFILKKGENNIHLKLHFNDLTHCIYFWNFDKSKVTNIKLEFKHVSNTLQNTLVYDGGIQALEDRKHAAGITDEPVVISFTNFQPFGERPMSTVDFSLLDCADLVIETTQEEETPVYIAALAVQGIVTLKGMAGLKWDN